MIRIPPEPDPRKKGVITVQHGFRGRVGRQLQQRVRTICGGWQRVVSDEFQATGDSPVQIAVEDEKGHVRRGHGPRHLLEIPIPVDIEPHAVLHSRECVWTVRVDRDNSRAVDCRVRVRHWRLAVGSRHDSRGPRPPGRLSTGPEFRWRRLSRLRLTPGQTDLSQRQNSQYRSAPQCDGAWQSLPSIVRHAETRRDGLSVICQSRSTKGPEQMILIAGRSQSGARDDPDFARSRANQGRSLGSQHYLNRTAKRVG